MTDAHVQVHAGAEAAHGHAELSYWSYFRTWVYLLILTVFEVGVVLAQVPRGILVPALLVLTVLKAALIFANFMHLRFERFGLVLVALSPIVFGVILFFGILPDF